MGRNSNLLRSRIQGVSRAERASLVSVENKVINGLMGWLAERGPDDWHEVANSYNWDRSVDPLVWIVSQPDCDRATVSALFWRASPDHALGCQTAEEARKAYNLEGYLVVSAIREQLEKGGYSRSEIAGGDASFYTREQWEEHLLEKGVDLRLPDWFWGPKEGRDLSRIRYTEGLPRPMAEWVWPNWPEGWGD